MNNKSCPYCGSDDLHSAQARKGPRSWYVFCDECNAEGPRAASEAKAWAAWNRRYVCDDKNGKKVFSDSIITGWRGDHEVDECRLQYEDFQWWAVEVQATYGVRQSYALSSFDQIELIDESDGEG